MDYAPKSSTPREQKQWKKVLDQARNRLIVGSLGLGLVFGGLAYRALMVTCLDPITEGLSFAEQSKDFTAGRAEIVDRDGEIIATSLATCSLYANARKMLNPKESLQKLTQVLPDLDPAKLIKHFQTKKRFIWLARHLTPHQQQAILQLGIPGIEFVRDHKRVYPHENLTSHVIGLTDVDNNGIAGVEKTFDTRLRSDPSPLKLSLSLKVQYAVRAALQQGIEEYSATGAGAVVMDLQTQEVLALVSLPDYNPHNPPSPQDSSFFNKITLGMYEMGSTMKVTNTAMALESGTSTLSTLYDTSQPLNVGRFEITDFRANHGIINVAQIFVYSSNKGAARVALQAGTETQKAFLRKLGYLNPVSFELPERGAPLTPRHWREANTITISYGYGLAISPLHQLNAMATITGGGCRKQATLLYQDKPSPTCARVISDRTSRIMRQLMHFVIQRGNNRTANVNGLFVAGKTGTRNLLINGGYQKDKVAASFVGILGENADKPKYIVLVLLEDPKRLKKTFGLNNASWNAAPIAGNILKRLASLMGLQPMPGQDFVTDPFLKQVSFKTNP